MRQPGADLRGEGGFGRTAFPQRPPADPKDPPLYCFEIILADRPKNFSQAPLPPKTTNFEGARAEKREFLVKFLIVLACFFPKLACVAENLVNIGS